MAAPRPTPFDYHILGLAPHAPVEACIIAHEHLTTRYDPRHRPPDEQGRWLDVQNALDESLALIFDAATAWGRVSSAAVKGLSSAAATGRAS